MGDVGIGEHLTGFGRHAAPPPASLSTGESEASNQTNCAAIRPSSAYNVTCAAPRSGAFCAACGERFLHKADLELKHFFFEQLPHELLHVDGKLPRSLRSLVTRPGELAVDYVSGRRQPYLGPLRLYLVVFLLHAFLSGLATAPPLDLPARAQMIDITGLTAHVAASRPEVDWENPELKEKPAVRSHWLAEAGTMLIFLFVALAQQLLFRRFHRRYLEHVTLALSVSTFYLLVISAGELVLLIAAQPEFGTVDSVLREVVGGIALPVYWYFAIRRFYGVRAWRAVPDTLLVAASHVLLAILTNVAVFALLIETA
jgi:Protein of unknown function (DUF3667)